MGRAGLRYPGIRACHYRRDHVGDRHRRAYARWGIGWLTRRHGLTIDNLLEAEVVTADGHLVTASDRENPDLFWGLRGGGGDFGIVTSFTYRLHQVGPKVLAGLVLWPLEDGPEVLRFYREFVATAPREVNTVIALRKAPRAPFLPPEL